MSGFWMLEGFQGNDERKKVWFGVGGSAVQRMKVEGRAVLVF